MHTRQTLVFSSAAVLTLSLLDPAARAECSTVFQGCPNGLSVSSCCEYIEDVGTHCWLTVGSRTIDCGYDTGCNQGQIDQAVQMCLEGVDYCGSPCNGGCCDGAGGNCCNGKCIPVGATCCDDGRFCPPGSNCSNGQCCPDPFTVYDPGTGYCCGAGPEIGICACNNSCPGVCCPDGTVCCPGMYCAPSTEGCPSCPTSAPERCGHGCMPTGAVCCGNTGYYCPNGLTCQDCGEIVPGCGGCGGGGSATVNTPAENTGAVVDPVGESPTQEAAEGESPSGGGGGCDCEDPFAPDYTALTSAPLVGLGIALFSARRRRRGE